MFADSVVFTEADDVERAAFKEQARKDWEKLLLLRSKELRTGAIHILFLTNSLRCMTSMFRFCAGGQLFVTVNAFLPDDVYSVKNIICTASQIWRNMRQQGVITQVQVKATISVYLFNVPLPCPTFL